MNLNLIINPIFKSTISDKLWATFMMLFLYFMINDPKGYMIVASMFIVTAITSNSVNQRTISKLEERIQQLENNHKTEPGHGPDGVRR